MATRPTEQNDCIFERQKSLNPLKNDIKLNKMTTLIKISFAALLLLFSLNGYSQSEKVKFSAFDGYAIVGYVNNGGFINFTGPNISYSTKESKCLIGLLPSLRFKEDNTGVTKNSFVTPNLGVGLTYSYKVWSFQIPLYYSPKTATENGKWDVGVGIGLRLNKIKKANP